MLLGNKPSLVIYPVGPGATREYPLTGYGGSRVPRWVGNNALAYTTSTHDNRTAVLLLDLDTGQTHQIGPADSTLLNATSKWIAIIHQRELLLVDAKSGVARPDPALQAGAAKFAEHGDVVPSDLPDYANAAYFDGTAVQVQNLNLLTGEFTPRYTIPVPAERRSEMTNAFLRVSADGKVYTYDSQRLRSTLYTISGLTP